VGHGNEWREPVDGEEGPADGKARRINDDEDDDETGQGVDSRRTHPADLVWPGGGGGWAVV
jgi:hypothetical protein